MFNDPSAKKTDFGEIRVFHDAWVGRFRRESGRGDQLRGGFQFPADTPGCFLDLNWQPEASPPDSHAVPVQSGNFLYAGLLDLHFGHFMVECIHRLWAWKHTGGVYDGLVFAPTPRYRPQQPLPGYVAQTLDWFGIPLDRVIFLDAPSRFARLHIPEVGKHRNRGPSPGYLALLAEVLDLPEPQGYGAWLYLSRKRLPWSKGRFLAESALEDGLARQGFEIVYPETLTLADQIARYRGAADILIAQGSAVHGLELLPCLAGRVAVIQRFRTEAGKVSLQGRVADYAFLDAIDWNDGFLKRNRQVSVLGPNRLAEALKTWIDQRLIPINFTDFFAREFDDFIQWFQFDIDEALDSLIYTESKAQSILSGYATHLARHGELTPDRRAQLKRLAEIYGNGLPLLKKLKNQ